MKINLKIVNEDKSVSSEQFEIEEVNLRRVTRSIEVIKDVISLAKDDEDLQNLIGEFFDEVETQANDGEGTGEEFGSNIIKHLTGAIDVLLTKIPEQGVDLLAALSGVEYETLMDQKLEDVFDVYDAIIEVNDIDKLVKRAKKSLALTKSQTKIMNLFSPKVAEEMKKKAPTVKQA